MGWHWPDFLSYLSSSILLHAAVTSLWIALVAEALGVLGGTLLAFANLSGIWLLRLFARAYLWVFRGTPLLVQILFFFAVLPLPPIKIKLGVIETGILALGLNESAYMAEIVRAGILSVGRGQRDAGRALGMTPWLITRLIVFPQATRVILPPLGNNFNNIMKATSLLSVISVQELLRKTVELVQATFRPLELYSVASLYYLTMTTAWGMVQERLERLAGKMEGAAAEAEAPHAAPTLVEIALPRLVTAAGPIVDMRGVSKRFGHAEILHDVSLSVRPGEVVVVLGPSGSGKSTLLRCINGLEWPDRGDVMIEGQVLGRGEHALARTRREVGMVFQLFNLFPHLTALQNVQIGLQYVRQISRNEAERRARALLAQVGLADKAGVYPAQLSGGQRQRVAIARALALQPKVMLFDEPTSALDPEMVQEVLEVMRSLARLGMTMIVVTHEMGFAREVADRMVFLEEGRVVEDAPAPEFFHEVRSPRVQAFLDKVL